MNSGPIRVLQVATIMNRGGLETFIMNLYRNIDRSKVQFDFLLHRDVPGAYDNEILNLGGKILYVPRANPFSYRYFTALDRFFSTHQYAIVHSHIDCMSSLPLSIAKKHGLPVRIAHAHSSSQDHDFKYPIKMLCKRQIRLNATDLFACGFEAGKWMFGTDDFTIVRNSIDAQQFKFDVRLQNEVRSELCIQDDDFVIGHVGRFSKVKNHSFLLRCFSEVQRRRRNSVLILVGDGDLFEEIKREAKALGLGNKIRFLGERSDVYRLMQAFDVFVLPSLYEGLPLVLIEAQAAGLPCVISDTIPSDCDITPLIKRVRLSDGLDVWANAITTGINQSRYSGYEMVCGAGFDASSTAALMQDFYLKRIMVNK